MVSVEKVSQGSGQSDASVPKKRFSRAPKMRKISFSINKTICPFPSSTNAFDLYPLFEGWLPQALS